MGGMGGFGGGMSGAMGAPVMGARTMGMSAPIAGRLSTPVVGRFGAPMGTFGGVGGFRTSRGTQFAFGDQGLRVRFFSGDGFRHHRFFIDNDDFFFPDRDDFFFPDRDDFFFPDRDDFFFRHHFLFPQHRFFVRRHRFFGNGFNSVIIVGAPVGGLVPFTTAPSFVPASVVAPGPVGPQLALLDDLTTRWLQNGALRANWSGQAVQVKRVEFSLLDSDGNVIATRAVRKPPYAVTFHQVPSAAVSLQLAIVHLDGSVDSAVQELSSSTTPSTGY